jgi:monoamine oxidase
MSAGSAAPDPVTRGPFDIAIIGAGAAGISAARVCREKPVSYVVIEARDRIGGRAWSDNSFTAPADLGAEWFILITPNPTSSLATNNPLFDIALKLSLQSEKWNTLLNLQPDVFNRTYYRDHSQVPFDDPDAIDAAGLFLEMSDAIDQAGVPISNGTSRDISAQQALAAAGLLNARFAALDQALYASRGADVSKLGVLDNYNIDKIGPQPVAPGPFNWVTPYGLGNFVQSLGDNLAVQLNTVAQSIYRDGTGVSITTNSGTIRAKKVIVTVPIGVLAAAGGLMFYPPLPAAYQFAFKGLPMGFFEKVAMEFDTPDVFQGLLAPESENTIASLLVDNAVPRVVQSRLWQSNVGLCLISGSASEALVKQGKAAMIDFAVESMRLIFGGSPQQHLVRANTAAWFQDEFSHGSYSYAPPNAVRFRKTLREPVEEKIYFAGEAVAVGPHGSLPGAWETGKAAAQAAIAAL